MSGYAIPCAVAVLTGFLGSGKTTLLRRILCDPGMSGTAVLINEFGEIGLDHLLVRSVSGDAVVLQNGCVCCTLRPELRDGLRALIDARSEGSIPPFERIVIETTGLADPAPIAQTLLLDPMLRQQVRLANIVTTVDAVHGLAELADHPETMRQVATADRLVITKTDLVAHRQRRMLVDALRRINPASRIFDVHAHPFDAAALLTEGIADPTTKLQEVMHWIDAIAAAGESHSHEEGNHLAHATHHLTDVSSFSMRIEEQIDWAAFVVWLTALLHRHGSRVLRVKGLLNVADAPGPIVLHGVQHVIHPLVHLECWPDDDRASRIVFVLQKIDPATLERSLMTILRTARTAGVSSDSR